MKPAISRSTSSALTLLALAFGCGVDGRSMSYEVSTLGSTAGSSPSLPAGGEPSLVGGAPGQAGESSGGAPISVAGTPDEGKPEAGESPGTQGGAPPNGQAGSLNQAGSTAQAGSGVAAGGEGAGGPNLPPPDPYPCGDLNLDGLDDCGQSLVHNPTFDQNSTGWVSEGALVQAWVQADARGSDHSGSLILTNNNVVSGASGLTGLASHQCIFAWSGEQLAVSARVQIPAQQAAGLAGVNLTFFGGDACEGDLLGGRDLAFTNRTETWVKVSGRLVVPAGTRSARVRLLVEKPFEAASFQASFDDVVVLKP